MYHVVTNHIKKNNDQNNNAIGIDTAFDNMFNLFSRTKYPLPVVTVSLQGAKKHRATTVAGLSCLWDSGATESRITIICGLTK